MPPTDDALNAVARVRAFGMHFFGHLLGITTVTTVGGQANLRLGASHPDVQQEWTMSPTALATLADSTLSTAIRNQLGSDHRLGTVTLGMQLTNSPAKGPVTAESSTVWVDPADGHGFARCELYDVSRHLIGIAQGWFVVLPVPEGKHLPPALWGGIKEPSVPALRFEDLTVHESAAVTASDRARQRANSRGTPLAEELLGLTWSDGAGTELVKGNASIGPELANRIGHVQGGAIYGAAVFAARRAAGPGMKFADGYMQYLTPADGATLSVEGRLLRRGRRATFVEVELRVDAKRVAAGQFSFRSSEGLS